MQWKKCKLYRLSLRLIEKLDEDGVLFAMSEEVIVAVVVAEDGDVLLE